MNKKIFKSTIMSLAIMLCAVSFAYAATECSIVQSSIPWDQEDQGSWISGVYQLTIECTDNGDPVKGYQAAFDITLMEGTNWENKIATLTTYSTPTDSDGIGYIIVPLIQVLKDDEKYIHICPFDDINCTGGGSYPSMASPVNSSRTASFTTASNPGCLNALIGFGCCETTITVTCCTPNISFTYCTTTTAGNCTAGTTHPDVCTTVTTTWSPNGTCNYCTGLCEIKTAISLATFTAKAAFRKVILQWKTETEIDNAGFNILRAETEDGQYAKINSDMILPKGKSIQGSGYTYIDKNVENGKAYFYKLEDIDLNGTSTEHGPVSATVKMLPSFFKK